MIIYYYKLNNKFNTKISIVPSIIYESNFVNYGLGYRERYVVLSFWYWNIKIMFKNKLK